MDALPRLVESVLLCYLLLRPDERSSFRRSLFLAAVTIAGTVWIDRKKNKDAIKAMGQAGEDMKRKGVSHRLLSPPVKARS